MDIKKRERVKHVNCAAGTPSWLAAVLTAPDESPEAMEMLKKSREARMMARGV